MTIEHTLLKKQKQKKPSLTVRVDLYPLATDLYNELDTLGIIQRMKAVPQLGAIRVSKKLKKSRYDYMLLQLYFHQLIKKNLQSALNFTYNNSIKSLEFRNGLKYMEGYNKEPSVGDLLQVLTIAYNIGHFYNTFAASRAAVIFANENDRFKKAIIETSEDIRYQQTTEKILMNANYQRYHLLNSLLVLQRCDQKKFVIQLAEEIIYAYINESELNPESKLHYVFDVFRSVRNVAYIAYDLQIAKIPLTIDICDSNSLVILFRELLSVYNDNSSTTRLVEAMIKLLDDTVYNKENDAICYYMVSSNIVKKLQQETSQGEIDYFALWENSESVFNISYSQHRDYIQSGILKLTFEAKDRKRSQRLFSELAHTNGVRAGYYDRNNGRQTLVISLKKKCDHKVKVAFRVLKIVVKNLKAFPEIEPCNSWYLLTSKFFLFYLMNEMPVVIKPTTVSPEVCVLCTKGRRKRVDVIEALLRPPKGNEDDIHEVENLCNVLKKDLKNDICISLPASIVVYKKEKQGKMLCEFDGMIIFPNRSRRQVVFLEAKNTASKPMYGKNCLIKKLKNLKIDFDPAAIEVCGKDAVLFYDI